MYIYGFSFKIKQRAQSRRLPKNNKTPCGVVILGAYRDSNPV